MDKTSQVKSEGTAIENFFESDQCSELAVERCSWENVFYKYAANLLKNTHAEVWFQ